MMEKRGYPSDVTTEDDGLYIPEVGDWAEEKYRLLWHYADLFATSMKHKWDTRCYIDLFSGSGYARIRGTNRVVKSSSLLALQVADPFDYYIYCDSDSDCISALKKRVTNLDPSVNCYFENCDVNTSSAAILSRLPSHSKNNKVLSFCLVDPFKLSDIKFETIKRLSSRFIDFLINIPAMDPIRNESKYYAPSSKVVFEYLGNPSWREIRTLEDPSSPFDIFVEKLLDAQMKSLGFNYGGFRETRIIRSTEKNLRLYSLGFYSRNRLGEKFWKEALKYSSPQKSLF
jgi:three-Cys-motif partner protein